jgi:hypothetical protein
MSPEPDTSRPDRGDDHALRRRTRARHHLDLCATGAGHRKHERVNTASDGLPAEEDTGQHGLLPPDLAVLGVDDASNEGRLTAVLDPGHGDPGDGNPRHGDNHRSEHQQGDRGSWHGPGWDHSGQAYSDWTWEQQCECAWFTDLPWYDAYCD